MQRRQRVEPSPIGADFFDRHDFVGIGCVLAVVSVALGTGFVECHFALLGQRAIDREWISRRFERFQPGINLAEIILPLVEFFRTVFRDQHELHERPVAFGSKAVAVEPVFFLEVPPGRRVVIVMRHRGRRTRQHVEIGVAVGH